MIRIGNGYDVHRLVSDRPLVIGGTEINWHLGLDGHSDADALLHAICDACLGALAKGDIGQHFPPNDMQYHNMNSRKFVRRVGTMLEQDGWAVINMDCTIVAEKPKMAPHIPKMKEHIASDLNLRSNQVNIKATTTEGLGFEGQQKGIAAYVVVLIERIVE